MKRRGPRHPSLTIRLTFIRPSGGATLAPTTTHVFFMAAGRPKKSQNGRREGRIDKLGKRVRRSFSSWQNMRRALLAVN